MALGSTQPLTEMSTSSISWGQRRPVRKPDNLTTILSRNMGTLTSWKPRGHSRPVTGLLLLKFNYDKVLFEFRNRAAPEYKWQNYLLNHLNILCLLYYFNAT